MYIVSIVNQKGGVAKTTTTANLGACLAARGYVTLLMDMDPQANLTLGLRRDWSNLPYGLGDVLLHGDRAPLSKIVRRIGALPLFLAPGHLEVARAETMLTRRENPAYHLRNELHKLQSTHSVDWVLIDCPPSLGALTQNALVASTHLLVPTEPKMYAFAGMDTLNRLIVGLSKDYEIDLQLLGVVLTMVERGTRLHRTITNVIRERFGDKVFRTEIYKNVRISEAEIEGKPVIEFDPRSSGARSYSALAEEVLQRVGLPPTKG